MGIKSIDWFKSYLSKRNKFVNVNDIESDPSLVTCGFPYGSVLCPLFFSFVIQMIWNSVLAQRYADDSATLYSNKDSQAISDKLGLKLEMCSKWLVDNKLFRGSGV